VRGTSAACPLTRRRARPAAAAGTRTPDCATPYLLELAAPLGEVCSKPLLHSRLFLLLALDASHLLVRILDVADVLTDGVNLRRLHLVCAQESVPSQRRRVSAAGNHARASTRTRTLRRSHTRTLVHALARARTYTSTCVCVRGFRGWGGHTSSQQSAQWTWTARSSGRLRRASASAPC